MRTQPLLQGMGVTASSFVTANMEEFNRSLPFRRGTRHLKRSWTVPQSLPRGAPNHTVHHRRAQASPTVSSCLTTQMSQGPWILVGNSGRKSPWLKLARLGWVLHQLFFSFWAAGGLKAAACFLTSFGPLWWADLSSHHQLSCLSLSSMYAQTQSLGVFGLGVGRCQALALYQAPLVFQDQLPWKVKAWVKGQVDLEHHTAWLVPQVLGFQDIQGKMWQPPEPLGALVHTPGALLLPLRLGALWACHQWGPTVKPPQSHHHPGALGGYTPLEVPCSLTQDSESIPNLSTQHWRAWTKVRVSSFLVTQKSLKPEVSTWESTIWKLLLGQGVTQRLWPAIRQTLGHEHCGGCPPSSPCKEP